MLKKLTVTAAAFATAVTMIAESKAQAEDTLYIPMTTYRTGPFAANGTANANGMWDYFEMLNQRDGGIGGAKLVVEECETGYNAQKGVECYESTKGKGALVYNPNYGDGPAFPDFDGLPSKWDKAAEYPSFYPNTLFAFHRDHFWAAHLDPKAHNRTIERVEIYYASEEAATSPDFAAKRELNAKMWKEVLSEDLFVTQGMQKGRGAPGFAGGVFSAVMDSPTHAFHSWVAERLAA